jgi:hypothetical protein
MNTLNKRKRFNTKSDPLMIGSMTLLKQIENQKMRNEIMRLLFKIKPIPSSSIKKPRKKYWSNCNNKSGAYPIHAIFESRSKG